MYRVDFCETYPLKNNGEMFHLVNVMDEKSRTSGEDELEKSVRPAGSETQRHLDKRKAYTIEEGFRREGPTSNKRR